MKRLLVTAFCSMMAWNGFAVPLSGGRAFAFSDRSSPERVMRHAKLMRLQGKYPASLECRAGKLEGPFAPIVRIDWQDNAGNIEWEMYVYRGQLEVAPSTGTDWKKVVQEVLPTGSDRFYCLLFYKR